MEYTRRRMLAATAGLAGLGAVAGCSGGSGQSNAAAVQSSFFVFGDIADNVAGDSATTDLLVPLGQHGHGWEPGPRVRENIYDASLFVHGMAGFQPWADDILADLSADGAEVTPVDASADVSLLEFGAGGHDEHEGEHHDEHGTDSHDDHGTDSHDEHGTDSHDDHGTDSHDDHGTDSHDDHGTDSHDDHGTDSHDDHGTETHDGHEETHEGEDGDHDHGSMDPHFWMDPRRVATAVGTVEQAMADLDGDNADSYAANAEAFRNRLTDLDERIESRLADASKDVLLVAGHDAFGYLAERYGVRVEALTDASPDDRPTPSDIERAQMAIDEHGLSYICADPLESQTAADQLVAETDAEAVLPLTAMPGLRESWAESDWGYVDVMEQVNLPTLTEALGAR
ncbi:zinc ABC transporter substrate-binding protein [Haloarcula sp. S1CR25-12]|uniref:Zinc ABC transporter substrate-binding protein n=1 Tax=Haloarcula saliterrae TaxID=2950534 RepID=A0ABU2FGZ5_9EURY|nr:metal ABC transporter substrate-binding protein [Haloarcula sp. S1CR25-12]MDS0261534.1 zinc ABC transporter substrate-binding protein [Haloarcula sp. S1CR25-12]